jgi:hypothetical protein
LFVGITYSDNVGLVARAVTISYPIMDLILFGFAAWLAAKSERSRSCYLLLCAALLLLTASDIGYMLQAFGEQYAAGSALDAGWLLSYAFFGAALLHPLITPIRIEPGLSPATRAASVGESYGSVSALQAIRLKRVLRSTGLMALGISGLALLVGTSWRASEVILLAGMYGTTGSLSVIGSALSTA